MDTYQYASSNSENYSIKWLQTPKPEFAGIQGLHPLVLSGTSMTSSVHVDLYASNSRSFPHYSKKGTWENLIPTWTFKDKDGNAITSLDITGTSGQNGIYTYEASAWFVDDLCTEPRSATYLWATMEMSANTVSGEYGMPSYANSKVLDVCQAKTCRIFPDEVRLTMDGKTPLSAAYHWIDHITPTVVSMHSKYYDALSNRSINTYPGIIYDFPGNPSATVPFYCTPITSREIEEISIGTSSVDGEPVYDEEGMPIPVTIPRFHYTRTPVVHCGDENYPHITSSLFTKSSADSDIESNENYEEIPIASSYEQFECPAFAQFDKSKDAYFIGGYTIGNFTMPDKAWQGGERYTAKVPIAESAPAYIPPMSIWAYSPSESAFAILPTNLPSTTDEIPDLLLNAQPPRKIHLDEEVRCIATDIEYNTWVATEHHLERYDFNGNKTLSVELDKTPTWIAVSPELEALRGNEPAIYVAYRDDGLITTHDINGNLIGQDTAESMEFDGIIIYDIRNDSSETMKPISIGMGKDRIWVAYNPPSENSFACLVAYPRHDGINFNKQSTGTIEWSLSAGEEFTDLLIDHDIAYVAISGADGARISTFKPSNPDAQTDNLVRCGETENIRSLSMDANGMLWFACNDADIGMFDGKSHSCHIFKNICTEPDSVMVEYLDVEYGEPAARESQTAKIDALSVDADDYLWVTCNGGVYQIASYDCGPLSNVAKSCPEGSPVQVHPTMSAAPFEGGTIYNNGDYAGIRLQTALNQCCKPEYATLDSRNHFVMNYDRLRFRRFNESRDIIADMKSCIRTTKFEIESKGFWDEFIYAMAGGVDNAHYHLGRRLYERIGNIVPNLHDIEDSNFDTVADMAKMQDSPLTQYNLSPPETLRRLMDILSCPHERIWGDRCHCTFNYHETNAHTKNKAFFCENCQHWHRSNLGDKFDIFGKNLLEDATPYVVRNPMDSGSKYIRINPSNQSIEDAKQVLRRMGDAEHGWNVEDYLKEYETTGTKPTDTHPLSDEMVLSLRKIWNPKKSIDDINQARLLAIHTQFFIGHERWFDQCFWKFNDDKCLTQNIGLVKWEDDYTTFPESADSLDSFYKSPDTQRQSEGNDPEGYMELILNYLLHNGLMFHKDGKFFDN